MRWAALALMPVPALLVAALCLEGWGEHVSLAPSEPLPSIAARPEPAAASASVPAASDPKSADPASPAGPGSERAGVTAGPEPGPARESRAPERGQGGIVVDSCGRPLDGARVERPGSWFRATHTGPDGEFWLEAIGNERELVVSHRFYLGETRYALGRGPSPPVRIVLDGPPAGAIAIHIRGQTATPGLHDVGVLVLPHDAGTTAATTGADPEMAEGLAPGRYTVRVVPHRGSMSAGEVVVDVVAGAVTDAEVILPPGRVIEGQVVNSSGDGASAVEVRWSFGFAAVAENRPQGIWSVSGVTASSGSGPPDRSRDRRWSVSETRVRVTSYTGRDGRFRLTAVPDAPVNVAVCWEGERVFRAPVPPGEPPLRIILPDTPPRLRVGLTGGGWWLSLRGPRFEEGPEVEEEARYRDLAPGRYVLWAQCSKRAQVAVLAFDLGSAPRALVIPPSVPAAVRCRTRAADADGTSLQAVVRARCLGHEFQVFPARWNSSGPVDYPVPANEDLALDFGSDGYERVTRDVRVAPGETLDLGDIRLVRRPR